MVAVSVRIRGSRNWSADHLRVYNSVTRCTTEWTAEALRAFERMVADDFEAKKIRAPVHLSGGNEEQLIEIFKVIDPTDWVFSTYRNHYHALLHGIPPERVRAEILAGKSMFWSSVQYHFVTSAIVGGILPIAVGVAAGIQRRGTKEKVWVFVGDMAATTGIFHEAVEYADGYLLPIEFIVEDNGFSTDSPTSECWGRTVLLPQSLRVRRYTYTRTWPHVNSGVWVNF